MSTWEFVENLFAQYEESDALADFKEELRGNLDERIAYLQKRGADPQVAFDKATGELGDISALADEISLQKKQEVFADMYMNTRSYVSPKRMALYLLCAGVFLFGVLAGILAWLGTGMETAGIGVMLPFGLGPAAAVIFLALTQETARNTPMGWKRALIYTVAASGFLFGVLVFALTFFVREAGLPAAIATLIPFCLPCGLLLAFLILTQPDRSKPWVREQQKVFQQQQEERFADPVSATRYGLLCGALWIFSFALFLALGLAIGFRYSWLTFFFAIGFQLLVEYRFSGQRRER